MDLSGGVSSTVVAVWISSNRSEALSGKFMTVQNGQAKSNQIFPPLRFSWIFIYKTIDHINIIGREVVRTSGRGFGTKKQSPRAFADLIPYRIHI